MAKEYVAYSGTHYQVEWYFSPKGESQARDYLEKLPYGDQVKLIRLFRTISETGRIHDVSKFRYEGDKIYAFKPMPHRFLCFFIEGKRIIVTNAFWKKQDKIPLNEKEEALKCMRSYRDRIQESTYYEKEQSGNNL